MCKEDGAETDRVKKISQTHSNKNATVLPNILHQRKQRNSETPARKWIWMTSFLNTDICNNQHMKQGPYDTDFRRSWQCMMWKVERRWEKFGTENIIRQNKNNSFLTIFNLLIKFPRM